MNLVDRIAVVVSASTQGATQEFQRLEQSAKRTQTSADRMGAAFGVSGKTLAAGVAAGAAAIVGTGLLHFLDQSVQAYGDSAKAAGDLAAATGSSAETVSRMSAALQDAGVSADATAGLLTKFTTNFGKNVELVEQLGVAVVKNKDGTTDYASTMVAAVDAIDGMGDASQRNAAFVKLFGKAGAQAFQDLHASGVKLSEAMRLVSKYRVFTAADVARAAAYDDAVDSLGASFQGLQFTIGRNLIPALSDTVQLFADLLNAATPVIDLLSSIPPEVYLVAGAAVYLSRVIKTELIADALTTLGARLVITGVALTSFRTLTLLAAAAMETLTIAVEANPVGVTLLLLTAAFTANRLAADKTAKSVEGYRDRLAELQEQGLTTAEAIRKTADEMEKEGGFLNNLVAAFGDKSAWEWLFFFPNLVKDVVDALRKGGDDTEAYRNAIEKMIEEQGEFAAVTAESTAKQDNLNDTVAKFLQLVPNIDGAATSWKDVAAAAVEANTAILGQKQAANAAETALGEYAVSIQQVVDWQKKLAGQPATVEEALNRIQTSFETLQTSAEGKQFWQRITDDTKTFGDESKKALGDTTQAVYDYIAALAATGMAAPDIVVNLKKLKDKLPDDLDKVVDEAIANVEGKPNEMSLLVSPTINFADPRIKDVTSKYDLRDPTQFKKWLDEVMKVSATPVSTDVTVTTSTDPVTVAATNAVVEGLTKDRTVDIYFQTHGYNEIERIINTLTRDRTVDISLATQGTGGGSGTSAGTPRGVTSQTTYGPTYQLMGDVRVEAKDTSAFAADLQRQTRRRRLVGLPA